MNFVEELKWRGMLHDMMPGTEEQLAKEMTTAYVGIDPTADSLHIGHLVSIIAEGPDEEEAVKALTDMLVKEVF